jgi:hypothetical protein
MRPSRATLINTRDRQRRAPVPSFSPLIICTGLKRGFNASCPGAEYRFSDCFIGQAVDLHAPKLPAIKRFW